MQAQYGRCFLGGKSLHSGVTRTTGESDTYEQQRELRGSGILEERDTASSEQENVYMCTYVSSDIPLEGADAAVQSCKHPTTGVAGEL